MKLQMRCHLALCFIVTPLLAACPSTRPQVCRADSECPAGLVCRRFENVCADPNTVPGLGSGGMSCKDDTLCTPLNTPCQVFTCKEGACVGAEIADGTPCNDGQFCSLNDACKSGSCGGTPKDCSALSAICIIGFCNEAKDACDSVEAPDGTACSDGAACTSESCSAGNCTVGTHNEATCTAITAGHTCNPGAYPTNDGCGPAPDAMSVTCETSQPFGADLDCAIALNRAAAPGLSFAGEAPRLTCKAEPLPLVLFSERFSAGVTGTTGLFGASGWTGITGTTGGAQDFVALGGDNPALRFEANAAAARVWQGDIVVPIVGLVKVCLDFDVAVSNAGSGERVTWSVGYETPPTKSTPAQFFDLDFGTLENDGVRVLKRTTCRSVSIVETYARFRLELRSDGDGEVVIVDNIKITGLAADYSGVSLLDDAFPVARTSASPQPWTSVTGVATLTTGALTASGTTVTLTDTFDTEACDVVELDYDFGESTADGGEHLTVETAIDGGAFLLAEDFDLSAPRFGTADGVLFAWLSQHRYTGLGKAGSFFSVRFTMISDTAGRLVLLDNVRARCVDLPEPAVLAITEPAPGDYRFVIRSISPIGVKVSCAWDVNTAVAAQTLTAFVP
ncbi:MAG: hypothetical protein IT381_06330 [Deltaproteobacteria bacterium]|nr:hypothetical protein [Deltaproteobacteria bacterium]